MKHAIIVAHPNQESFNLSVARAFQAELMANGHQAVLRDLYAMDFDPRLHAQEIPGAKNFSVGRDVLAERDLLAGVQVFAFVYPLWLNAPPAIMKGYLDRVFGIGFAYGAGSGGTVPLLKGRSMISFTSSGAPESWVRSTGAWDALNKLFANHLASVCGLTIVDHLHFGNILPGMRADAAERYLAQVRAAAAKHF